VYINQSQRVICARIQITRAQVNGKYA